MPFGVFLILVVLLVMALLLLAYLSWLSAGCSEPHQGHEKTPGKDTRGRSDGRRFYGLPYAHYLLDLLGEGLLLFLLSPTLMLLMPVAGFLLHQPALGDPACLSFEVAVLARVAHRLSPPSA
jgi:hypothetical protein